MDFDLSPEQERIQRAAREFAAREVAPGAAARDRGALWPGEVLARLGALGWLGAGVPPELGGAGLDAVCFALVVEEVSFACAGVGAILAAHDALFCRPLHAFGTAAQHREILAPAAAGRELGAAAFGEGSSEPVTMGGGPPYPPAQPVAERQPDGSFVLHGSTGLVTAAPAAEHLLVVARLRGAETPPNPPVSDAPRSTALLVRRGAPGLTVGAPVETMGARAAHACTLAFAGVRVPQGSVVGAEGTGAEVARVALDAARVGVAARAVGIARAALEKAAARAASNKPPQAIQFLISDMAVEVDAARLLVLRAARRLDEGAGGGAEGAVAKLFASEAATRVAHRAMSVFGGEGTTVACGVERHYRDARSTEIDEGTSEAQRLAIARAVLAG